MALLAQVHSAARNRAHTGGRVQPPRAHVQQYGVTALVHVSCRDHPGLQVLQAWVGHFPPQLRHARPSAQVCGSNAGLNRRRKSPTRMHQVAYHTGAARCQEDGVPELLQVLAESLPRHDCYHAQARAKETNPMVPGLATTGAREAARIAELRQGASRDALLSMKVTTSRYRNVAAAMPMPWLKNPA